MPFERLLAKLGDVRWGAGLGFATAALLVLASFFVPDPRKKGALPFSESILPFLDPVDAKYWWFYLLLGVTLLWGLSGLAATLHSALRRRGDLRFVGILLMHLGFLGGLGAHAVAGFGTAVEAAATLGSAPTELGGHVIRVLEAEILEHPDGSTRGLRARVTVDERETTLGYNDPVFLDGFRRWILVQGPKERRGELGIAVVLRRNDGLPFVGAASVLFLAGLVLFGLGMARRGS